MLEISKKYPLIQMLAKNAKKTVSIFDFETNGLLGADDLGITEMAILSISPSGAYKRWSSLLDPKGEIPKEVTRITGITEEMVAGKPDFGQIWPQVENSFSDHLLFGFNSNKFDMFVLKDQMDRHNISSQGIVFKSYDVRSWHQIAGGFGPKGTLKEVASMWSVGLPDKMHRAMADVEVTAGIMEALLREYGMNPLRDQRIALSPNTSFHLFPKKEELFVGPITERAEDIKKPTDVLSWITSENALNGYKPLAIWAAKLGTTREQLEEIIETSIDTQMLKPADFSHQQTQQWLMSGDRLRKVLEVAYPEKKDVGNLQHPHKMLFDMVIKEKPVGVIMDFVQLRIGMKSIHAPYITRRELLEKIAIEPAREMVKEPTTVLEIKKPRPRFTC